MTVAVLRRTKLFLLASNETSFQTMCCSTYRLILGACPIAIGELVVVEERWGVSPTTIVPPQMPLSHVKTLQACVEH